MRVIETLPMTLNLEQTSFVHRTNSDRTLDSICLKCFMTVCKSVQEGDLEPMKHSSRI